MGGPGSGKVARIIGVTEQGLGQARDYFRGRWAPQRQAGPDSPVLVAGVTTLVWTDLFLVAKGPQTDAR